MKPCQGFGAWLLHALHFLLALSVPLVFLLLNGCLKGHARQGNLGTPATEEAIDAALQKQMNNAVLSTLKVGQYVDFAVTRRVEDEDVDIPMGSLHVAVLNRQDTATQATFTMKIAQSTVQADGSFQTVVSEDSLLLNKSPTSAATSTTGSQAVSPSPGATQQITYYNLTESDGVMDAPQAVTSRAGCGGLTTCSLPVHYVQFDMVVWQDSSNYQKTSFDLAFSVQSPYIPYGSGFNQLTGLLVVDCRSTYLDVSSGAPVYVRDCSTLDDFQK